MNFESLERESVAAEVEAIKPREILDAMGAESSKEMAAAFRAIAEMENYTEEERDEFLEEIRTLEKAGL